MNPYYMMTYTDYNGNLFTEWFDDVHEAWLRYAELIQSGVALNIEVYTRMIHYSDKAE